MGRHCAHLKVEANAALPQIAVCTSLGLLQLSNLEDGASRPSCKQVLCVASHPILFWTAKCCQQEVKVALRCLLLCF